MIKRQQTVRSHIKSSRNCCKRYSRFGLQIGRLSRKSPS